MYATICTTCCVRPLSLRVCLTEKLFLARMYQLGGEYGTCVHPHEVSSGWQSIKFPDCYSEKWTNSYTQVILLE